MRKQRSERKHQCLVCGKVYNLCRSCDELKNHGVFSWRATCDTVECFQVFMVLNDFNYGKISKEEARTKLDGIIKADMQPFTLGARRSINKIYDVDDIIQNGDKVDTLGFTPSKDDSTVNHETLSVFYKKS